MRRYQLSFITKQGIKLPCFKILEYNKDGDLVKTEMEGLGDLVGEMVVARPYIAQLNPDKESHPTCSYCRLLVCLFGCYLPRFRGHSGSRTSSKTFLT
jgi:hypothetical protein